jgi:flagellar basal body-associated protein FliL
LANNPPPKGKEDPKAKEAEGEAEVDAGAEAKKAKKKRMLILAAAVVGGIVLGGGGVGAYFIFGHKNEAVKPLEVKENAAEKEKAPAAPAIAFVNLANLTAPIVDNGKTIEYVMLDFALEVTPGKEEASVFQQLPVLRAAFLKEVTEHSIGTAEDPTVIDYGGLQDRLLDVANQAIKDGAIKRVLVTRTIRQ